MRLTRAALVIAGGAALLLLSLLLAVAREPLPEALTSGPGRNSVRILDRGGALIDEYRPEQGRRSAGVSLERLPSHVIDAVLAAEDLRFYGHPGVDPLAMARAGAQAVRHRRIVSGASTITQQLARNLVPRPRTLRGKVREMVIALRLERDLDKDTILAEYLSRIEYAPGVRGLEAASRVLFDKPAERLDLAEAALLAGLPRGPSFYDPSRGTERARQRRDRVLDRMERAGLAAPDAVARAKEQPIVLQRARRLGGAEHLVRSAGSGRWLPPETRERIREVHTTIDGGLQATVQGLTRGLIGELVAHDVSNAAVLVVDNETAEVLAYVGSPDFWSEQGLGQNDGTRALRQPGSTLKPFVYAAAIESLAFTPATLLPDVELRLPTPQGDYAPRNYDGRFRGPVRLREALASSLNVPAVYAAQRVGPARVLAMLHRFGFDSLERDASHYGAAIALGDGEVTLTELASAYAALARDGVHRPLRFVRAAFDVAENSLPLAPNDADATERRAIPAPLAHLLTDMLADPHARQAGFGRHTVLDLPFPAAVKTGTSKGFRDNWTIGFTREVTVAVWVGNFDGRPMRGTSGVTGAGPLFREVMLAAMRDRDPAPLRTPEEFVSAEVCPLSGALPTADCPHRVKEHFLPGHVPGHRCTFHQRVSVASSSGLRATRACKDAVERVFEVYPEQYLAWARAAQRPLPPSSEDPRCPGGVTSTTTSSLAVAFPHDGARFALDPSLARAQQRILLRARGVPASARPVFVLDGMPLGPAGSDHQLPWQLEPGTHRLHVEAGAARSATIRFHVE